MRLAEKGRLTTSPNPMVGAVIVKNGRTVGEGYHRAPGLPHAEKNAIRKAAGRTKGATMYVNLEPCSHTGRTGPCCEAIIEAGLKKVVYALKDPDPRVNGRGLNRLRRAGVKVESGPLKKEARLQNDKYFGYHRNGRPFIILKMAQTLDGRIAAADGSSRWISSPPSRRLAHRLRAEVDAVMVGMGTVRADNPSLTVRNVRGSDPYRIVVSGSLSFPRNCRLLSHNTDYKTIVATTGKAVEKFARTTRGRNLIYWQLKANRRRELDLDDLLLKAADFGIRSILIEGGSGLAGSFLKAGLVDKLCMITAPMILGSGLSSIGDLGGLSMKTALKFTDGFFELCGSDVVFIGYIANSKGTL